MVFRRITMPVLVASVVALGWPLPAAAQRTTLSLDGTWSVAEGIQAEEVPASFDHKVAVPGLTNQARPAFPDVDRYETHEFVFTMKHNGVLPASEKCEALGRTPQKRNYFWYERTFTAPARRDSAVLVVNKAQFGAAVWLNGKNLGEHLGCFTAGRFDATAAMNWSGENRLLVRIGAHPGALPVWALYGTDGEKAVWTPGIYDRVSLLLADAPTIETIQVAPQIQSSTILVQTRLRNPAPARVAVISQRLKTWKDGRAVGRPVRQEVALAAGEETTVAQTVSVPRAVLWSPDNPFLYVLDTSTGGDSCSTRFGMREFRCSTASRRAMLNGKVIYLRGASITLHRFFGDPQCGNLPWNEAWVRRFLVDIPKQMHWNAFRVCFGPAPQQWLDIADEAGILLQYEFPIWSDRECRPDGSFRHVLWKENDVVQQVREFMRDNWNHPSVAIWDASNETHWAFLKDKLIPAVRGLDLSDRPWENGYNLPQGPDDPYEWHPYKFIACWSQAKPPYFEMSDLEKMTGANESREEGRWTHASIINEYDWLWLHRDGTPTTLARKVYEHLLGPGATPDQRREACAYYLAGLTEFWRASREHAGVMYLAYLDADLPRCFTCDNFSDVQRPQLEAHFADYMGEAFKPLGLYVNFWQPTLPAGGERSYRVTIINDSYEPARGRLELGWQFSSGAPAAADAQQPWDIEFAIPAVGRIIVNPTLATPATPGRYVLVVKASCEGKPWSPTVSRRNVAVGK